jgi:glycosyltransferase involved in cell wall biosynthesis
MNLASSRANPHERQIIWDGLGLSSPFSGVGYYGSRLYEACVGAGRSLRVTAFGKDVPPFVGVNQVLTVDPLKAAPFGTRNFFAKAGRLKPVFSSLSYHEIKQHYPAVTYHGLSNINLPVFVKPRAQDRFVITIHDIIPLLNKDLSPLSIQTRILVPRVMGLAHAIIVPSHWTRKTLLDVFGNSHESKIHIIPNGTSTPAHQLPERAALANELTCDVLSVARGEAYKRLELVLEIARALPSLSFNIVTDRAGQTRLGGAPDNVKIFCAITAAELAQMYQSSKVFLHTSLFEGWCLPAADAVMARRFVVYVKGTGIDDVCAFASERCLALEPEASLDSWVEAVRSMVAQFKEPSASAHKVTELPTWQSCAEKTLKIYDSLL